MIDQFETDDCVIAVLEEGGERYVLKQIKDACPDEQCLLVIDFVGCGIGNDADVPVNRVEIIPPGVSIPGKTYSDRPSTLHTFAKGICIHEVDIHQRYRKENSPWWKKWGPLPPESTGLTREVIKNMAKHPDLIALAALDTFVGNADRSAPNLYYDEESDRFCGIDMAASFNTQLAKEACRQIENNKEAYTDEEIIALKKYGKTLELLMNLFPPSTIINFLHQSAVSAGLCHDEVKDRISYHSKQIELNYRDCEKLRLMIFYL